MTIRWALILVVDGFAFGSEVVSKCLIAMSQLVLGSSVVASSWIVEECSRKLCSATIALHGDVAGWAVS